jgi:hypothetical protein
MLKVRENWKAKEFFKIFGSNKITKPKQDSGSQKSAPVTCGCGG